MMERTDRHDRYFLRLISRRVRLYSEMVTAEAVLNGDRRKLLDFDAAEHPLALQLGGSAPERLAEAARIGADWGYDEINLNVGCPSDRVQSGAFGACLMQTPDLVADCVAAMRAKVDVPVSVKCRLGVDKQDPHEALFALVEKCRAAGVSSFIVHARKAWLEGLSPKENRTIPPLDYAPVYELKRAMPQLTIVINGGIATLDEAAAHLAHVDGVMLGRAAYADPYLLSAVDARFFGATAPPLARREIVEALVPYAERLVASGRPLHALTRHLAGLYRGCPGGRRWRQRLSAPTSDPHVLLDALAAMDDLAA